MRIPLFNHSFYCVEYDTYFPGEVPWHWHDEIELISIVAGSALYKTGGRNISCMPGMPYS